VKYSTKKSKRANKLVATNAAGYLPSNIIRPKWGYLKGVPAGFKDGVDNKGVWKVTITQEADFVQIPAGGKGFVFTACPTGTKLVGGGFSQAAYDVRIADSSPQGNGWIVSAESDSTELRNIWGYAMCLATNPSSALASKGS